MHARATGFYPRAYLYFALLLLTALIGFFPSFYSRMTAAKPVHQFHGAVATLWMLLLITQAWLYRARKLQLHRMLGKTSLLLVPLFVWSALLIVHGMVTAQSGFGRAFGARLAFIDSSSVAFFVFAYCAALYYRRDLQLHARFMACTGLLLLIPAMARVLGFYVLGEAATFQLALHLSYTIMEVILIALLLHDRSTGRMRAPYLLLLALSVVQQASFELITKIGPWNDFIASLRA